MKETTGEFSMTVVTIIAVVAIAGVVAALRGPLGEWIETVFEGQFGRYEQPVDDGLGENNP